MYSPRLEGIAQELLDVALMEAPVDAMELAACCGLEVRLSEIRDALLYDGTIYVSRRARISRIHLLVAHELGHWALARAAQADSERDADYLAGALLVPRRALERDLRSGWDLDALRAMHVHAPASTIATRIAQVREATAAIYDQGRLSRRVGPELASERELVARVLGEERAVRVDATTGAWPVIEGRSRRVIVVGSEMAATTPRATGPDSLRSHP